MGQRRDDRGSGSALRPKRRVFDQATRRKILDDWQRSKDLQRDFCARRGISVGTLQKWARAEREASGGRA